MAKAQGLKRKDGRKLDEGSSTESSGYSSGSSDDVPAHLLFSQPAAVDSASGTNSTKDDNLRKIQKGKPRTSPKPETKQSPNHNTLGSRNDKSQGVKRKDGRKLNECSSTESSGYSSGSSDDVPAHVAVTVSRTPKSKNAVQSRKRSGHVENLSLKPSKKMKASVPINGDLVVRTPKTNTEQGALTSNITGSSYGGPSASTKGFTPKQSQNGIPSTPSERHGPRSIQQQHANHKEASSHFSSPRQQMKTKSTKSKKQVPGESQSVFINLYTDVNRPSTVQPATTRREILTELSQPPEKTEAGKRSQGQSKDAIHPNDNLVSVVNEQNSRILANLNKVESEASPAEFKNFKVSLGTKRSYDTLARQENERKNKIQALRNSTQKLQEICDSRTRTVSEGAVVLEGAGEGLQSQEEISEVETQSSETIQHISNNEHAISPNNWSALTETSTCESSAAINQMIGPPTKSDRTNLPSDTEPQQQLSSSVVARTDHSQFGPEAPSLHPVTLYNQSILDTPLPTPEISLVSPDDYSPLRSIQDPSSQTEHLRQSASYAPHSPQFFNESVSGTFPVPSSHLAQFGYGSESLHTPSLPPHTKESPSETFYQQQPSETSVAHPLGSTSFHAKPVPDTSVLVSSKLPQLGSKEETLLNPSMPPFSQSSISDTESQQQLLGPFALHTSPSFHKPMSDNSAVERPVTIPTSDVKQDLGDFENKQTDYFQQIDNSEEGVGELSEKFHPSVAETTTVFEEPVIDRELQVSELDEEGEQLPQLQSKEETLLNPSMPPFNQSSISDTESQQQLPELTVSEELVRGSELQGSELDEKGEQSQVEQEPDISVQPLVKLPEYVPPITGEEKEEIKFKQRAKLYRYDSRRTEWKERGVGDLKILYNPETQKHRILMHRDQVLKLCANHYITENTNMQRHVKSVTSCCWVATDYSDNDGQDEMFAVRFNTTEDANDFLAAVEEAKGHPTQGLEDEAYNQDENIGLLQVVEGEHKVSQEVENEKKEEDYFSFEEEKFVIIEEKTEKEVKEAKIVYDTKEDEKTKKDEDEKETVETEGEEQVKQPEDARPHKGYVSEKEEPRGDVGEVKEVEVQEVGDKEEEKGKIKEEVAEVTDTKEEKITFKERAELFYDVHGNREKLCTGNLIISVDEKKKKAELEMLDGEEQIVRHPVRKETKLVPLKGSDREYVWTTEAHLKGEKKAKKMTFFVRFGEAGTANQFQEEFQNAQSVAKPSKTPKPSRKKSKGKTKEAVSNEREDDSISLGSRASKGDGVEKAHEKDTQRVMDSKDELVEADAKVRDAETREQREEKVTPHQSERESEKVLEEETKQPEIVREEDVEEQEEDKEKNKVGLGSQEIREEEKESLETVNEKESSERDNKTGEKVHEEGKESLKDSKDEEEVQTNINVGDIETSEHRDKKTTPSKLGKFLLQKIKEKFVKEERTRPEGAEDEDVSRRPRKDESLSSVDVEEEAEKKSLGGVSLKGAKEGGEKQSKWKGSRMSLRSLKSFKDVIFDQKASLLYDVKDKWEKLASGNLTISVDEKKKAELEMLDGDEQIVRHPVRKETQLVPAKGTNRAYVWTTEAHLKGEKKAKKMTFFVRFGEADTANQFQEEFQNAQSEETLTEILKSRRKQSEDGGEDRIRRASKESRGGSVSSGDVEQPKKSEESLEGDTKETKELKPTVDEKRSIERDSKTEQRDPEGNIEVVGIKASEQREEETISKISEGGERLSEEESKGTEKAGKEELVSRTTKDSRGGSVSSGDVEQPEKNEESLEGVTEETKEVKPTADDNKSIEGDSKTDQRDHEEDTKSPKDLKDEKRDVTVADNKTNEQREEEKTSRIPGEVGERLSAEESKGTEKAGKEELANMASKADSGNFSLGDVEEHQGGKTKEAVSNEREDDLISVGSRASKGDGVEKAHEKDTQRVMDLKDELVEADAKVRDAETRKHREKEETPRQSERESEKVPEGETKQPEIVGKEDVEEQEEDKEKNKVGLGSQEIREEEKESLETVNEKESSERDSKTGEKVHEEDKESLKDSKDEDEVKTNINVGDIETSEHRDKKTTPSKLGKLKEKLLPGKIKEKFFKEERTRPEGAGDEDVSRRSSKDESLSSVDAEEAEKKSLGGVSLKSATEEGEKQSKWKGSRMSLRSLKSFKDVIFDQKASLFCDVKGKWEKLASGNLTISVDEKKKTELEMLDGYEQIVRHPVRKEIQLVPAKGSDREYVWTTEAHLKGEKRAKKMTFFVRFGEADTANQFQEEFQNAQSEEKLTEILKSRRKQSEDRGEDRIRKASKESRGGSVSSGDVEQPKKNEESLEGDTKETKELKPTVDEKRSIERDRKTEPRDSEGDIEVVGIKASEHREEETISKISGEGEERLSEEESKGTEKAGKEELVSRTTKDSRGGSVSSGDVEQPKKNEESLEGVTEETKEVKPTADDNKSIEGDSKTEQRDHEEDTKSPKDLKDEKTDVTVADNKTNEQREEEKTSRIPGEVEERLSEEESKGTEKAGKEELASRASKADSGNFSLDDVEEHQEGGEKTHLERGFEEKKKEHVKQSTWKGSILSLKSLSKEPQGFKHVIFDQKASLFYDVKGKWEKLASGNLKISVNEKKKAELEMLDGGKQIMRHPVRKEIQLVPGKGSDREYVWTTEAHLKGEKKAKKMTFFVRFGEAGTANQFQEKFQNAQSEEKLAEILQSRKKKDEGAAGDAERLAESIPEERQVAEVKEDKSGPDKEGKVEKGDQMGVEESRADGDQEEVKIKEDARKETEEDEKGAMKSKSDGAEKIQDLGDNETDETVIVEEEGHKEETPNKDESAVEGTPEKIREKGEPEKTSEGKLEEDDVKEVSSSVTQEQQKDGNEGGDGGRDGGADGQKDVPVKEKSVSGRKEEGGADSHGGVETDDGDEVRFAAEAELFYDKGGEWDKQGSGAIKIVISTKDGTYQVRMKKDDKFIANHPVKKETQLVPAKGNDRSYVWTTENLSSGGKPKKTTFLARFKTSGDAESFQKHFEEGKAPKKKKKTPSKKKKGKEKR